MKQIKAPFTPKQVMLLNKFQNRQTEHPFTCGGEGRTDEEIHGDGEGVLVATVRGWICPYCNYTQNWAWEEMTIDLDKCTCPKNSIGIITKLEQHCEIHGDSK